MILTNEYCNNEKYFNAIRYLYHLEESEARKDIILDKLIIYNIVLAASCVATDVANSERESKLISIARNDAREFSKNESSTRALLALSELKQYSIIIEIFNEIEKPQIFHKQVLRNVFQQADESVFLRFIESFTNYKYFNVISTEFLHYPRKLIGNSNSLEIIRRFILFLNQQGLTGFVRLFLEKYDLLGHAGYFFNDSVEQLIIRLLSGNRKEIYLGYSIMMYNEYSEKIGQNNILDYLTKTKDQKTIKLAIEFALRKKKFDHQPLNDKINSIILFGKKKNLRKLLFWLRNGLIEYCNNIPSLKAVLIKQINDLGIDFEKYQTNKQQNTLESKSESIISIINQYNSNEGVDRLVSELLDVDINALNEKDPLNLFWCRYFLSNNLSLKNIPIEVFIERSYMLFDVEYRDICHVLRQFEFEGRLANSSEFGYYFRSNDFKSVKSMFLHPEQVPKNVIVSKESIYKIRIVGYNQITKRINISLYDLESIIEMSNNRSLKN